jgi:hypothetical protein
MEIISNSFLKSSTSVGANKERKIALGSCALSRLSGD